MSNETIWVVESKPSDVEILNQGRLEGIGIVFGIGLIAFIGFIVRGLFIYFLKYEAPKDRPINSLMFFDQVRHKITLCIIIQWRAQIWRSINTGSWEIKSRYLQKIFLFQVIQMSSMSVVSVMTMVSIFNQTPMVSIFPQNTCYIFWATTQIYGWNMVTSSIGRAIYRLLCFHNLFKRNINTKKMVRQILLVQLIIAVSMISVKAFGYSKFGWEKATHYQFCSDMGPDQIQTLHEYNNEDFSSVLNYKTFKFTPILIAQTLVLAELFIYFWLIYHLWKHDKESFEDKIITRHTR